MIKETVERIFICDICNKEVEGFAKVSQKNMVVIPALLLSRFGMPGERADICSECSDKLVELMHEIRKNSPKYLHGAMSSPDVSIYLVPRPKIMKK